MAQSIFTQLLSAEQSQRLVETCHRMTGLYAAILDATGTTVAAAGSHDPLCPFHHQQNDCCELHRAGVCSTAGHVPDPAGEYLESTCTRGLRQLSTPLVIDGTCVATLIAGRFFSDHDAPEQEQFRTWAREATQDEEVYLDAFKQIPVFSREGMFAVLDGFREMVRVPLEICLKNLADTRAIDEHKRAEESLRESGQKLAATIRNLPLPMFVLNKEQEILYWNTALEELSGVKAADVIGTNKAWSAFYGEERPVLANLLAAGDTGQVTEWYGERNPPAKLAEEAFEVTEFFPGRDEKGKWLHLTAAVLRDTRGNVVGALETLEDVTERKLAEEKWRSLFNNLPGGSFTVNSNYIIEDVNDVLCAATGYSREELVGQLCGIICPKGPHLCPIFDLGKDRIDNDETAVKARDGRHVPIIKSARRIPVGNREIIVENFQDITDRKHLEEQLRHAQKMEAIGQLAGGVAHDFNNMLTAIIGYGNLLQIKTAKTPSLAKYVNQIIYSAEQAANLTSNLLAFSRKQPVKLQPVLLNDIITKSRGLLTRLVREDIKLRISTCGNCAVRADSVQIEQIMMNLVTNARDAMPDGGRLTITTGLVTLDQAFIRKQGYGQPGPYALISVSDTGLGMDGKLRERIFEPFFTTKKTGKGTGLGLAIVYGIIKQHHGYIDVHSKPGKGTTFRIYLPILLEEIAAEEKSELTIPPIGSETILLAEDDPVVRNLAKTLLEECGYRVIEAVDGAEAVEKFLSHADAIQLLLFDVMMPEKNGKEAYYEIKKSRPEVKALFMSGYTDDILSSSRIPADNPVLIVKPFTQTRLLHMVRETLDEPNDQVQESAPSCPEAFLRSNG